MAFTQTEEKTRYIRKYDVFNNLADRSEIKKFDAEYPHNNFTIILEDKGLFRKSDRYPEGAIDESRITEVNDVMDKLIACNDLMKLADYGARQEKIRLEPLYNKIALNN